MPTTQLPPLDGEADPVSAAAIDAGQAQAYVHGGLPGDLVPELELQPLGDGDADGPAAPVAIIEASAPPGHAEPPLASELPVKLRLSDAEEIAQARLDGAAEGSLREALAIAPAEAAAPDTAHVAAETLAPAGDAAVVTLPAPEHAAPEPAAVLPPPPAEVAAEQLPAEPRADQAEMREPWLDAQSTTDEAAQQAAANGAIQPLTSALDAATKLAADANAAAHALESLQRLLERQLPNGAPAAAAVAPPQPPPVPAPPPLDRNAGRSPREAPASRAALPPMQVPQLRGMPAERVRLDVRGFLAGFALSWAFGIVLYLFMTAG